MRLWLTANFFPSEAFLLAKVISMVGLTRALWGHDRTFRDFEYQAKGHDQHT